MNYLRGNQGNNHRRKNSMVKTRLMVALVVASVITIAAGIFMLIRGKASGTDAAAGLLHREVADIEEEVMYLDGLDTPSNLGQITKLRVDIQAEPSIAAVVTPSCYVEQNGNLTLKADIKNGYVLEGWYNAATGGLISKDNNYALTGITSEQRIIARFSRKVINITTNAVYTTNADPNIANCINGGGVVLGGGTLYGTNGADTSSMTLKVIPDNNYKFKGWIINRAYDPTLTESHLTVTTDASKQGQENTVVVNLDTEFIAVFEKTHFQVSVGQMPGVGTVSIEVAGASSSGPNATVVLPVEGMPVDGYALHLKISYSFGNVQYGVDKDSKPQYRARYRLKGLYRIGNDGKYNGEYTHNWDWFNEHEVGHTIYVKSTEDQRYVWMFESAIPNDAATFGAMTNVFPANAGTTAGDGTSTLIANYQLKAAPNMGYEFDHWEWYENGVLKTSTESSLGVTPHGYILYTAYFVPKTINVTLNSVSPPGAATVTGLGKYIVDGTGEASPAVAILPAEGYELESWSITTKDNKIEQPIPVLTDNKYTAGFTASDDVSIDIKMKQVKYRVSAEADPVIIDDSHFNYVSIKALGVAGLSSNSTEVVCSGLYDANSTVTITAHPGSKDSVFKQWICSNGTVIPKSSCTGDDTVGYSYILPTLDKDLSYTAQFEKETYDITVAVDSATPYGSVEMMINGQSATSINPAKVIAGSEVILKAVPNDTDSTFAYWTTGSGEKITGEIDEATGVSTLRLSNVRWDGKYTATFARSKVNIIATAVPSKSGLVSVNGSQMGYTAETIVQYKDNVSLYAEASSKKYTFERWEDEYGKVYKENPLQIIGITKDTKFTAVFNSSEAGVIILASPASGGVVTKDISSDGKTATLKAIANTGYKFVRWVKRLENGQETTVSNSSRYEATDLSDGITYVAYFSGGSLADVKDARLSITNEHYYDEKRINTNPNYTVTREGMEQSAKDMIALEKTQQYSNSTPSPKDYTSVENAKSLYDDIQVVDDRSALLLNSELVTSEGHIIELSAVPVDETFETLAAQFVEGKYGNKYSYEIIGIRKLLVPSGFDSDSHTFIWKKLPVYSRDNIVILCSGPGSVNTMDGPRDWVSCMVDEGSSLRFTTSGVTNGTQLCIVKVILK